MSLRLTTSFEHGIIIFPLTQQFSSNCRRSKPWQIALQLQCLARSRAISQAPLVDVFLLVAPLRTLHFPRCSSADQ